MREGLVGAEVTNLTVIVEKTGSDQSPMGATHRSSCLASTCTCGTIAILNLSLCLNVFLATFDKPTVF